MPFIYFPRDLKFPNTMQLEENLYRVEDPFVYIDKEYGYTILVPPNFQTDYGSVPRAFWNIIPPQGILSGAYILHDWLYATKLVSRSQADWIFLGAIKELGSSWVKRNTIYSLVRSCGWSAWKGHKQKSITKNMAFLNTFLNNKDALEYFNISFFAENTLK